jgi:MFS family permease
MGVGAAGLINLAIVIIGDHWDGKERVTQVGRNAAVITVGLALMPLTSGMLASVGGWRLSLAPSALALVVAAVAWNRLDDVRPPHASVTLNDQLRSAAAVLRTPTIAATIASGFLLFVMIFGLFLTTLPVHLEQEFSLSAAPRGVLIAIPSITSTLVALNLARLRSRFGLRALLVVGAASLGVSLLTVGASPTVAGVVVGLLVYGLGEGAIIPSLQETAVARASPAQRGVVLATWVAAVRLGQSIGPLLFAAMFDRIGTSATLMLGSLVCIPILLLHGFTSMGEDTAPQDSP